MIPCVRASLLSLTLASAGCSFSASTEIRSSSETDDTGANSDTAEDTDTDTGAAHPSDVDDDGDGYTENEGDCDDDEQTVNPGVSPDDCDGLDSDCDDDVDEDARDDDPYEPNDSTDYELGSIDDGDATSVTAWLHNDEDVDRFTFSIDDSGWSTYTLQVELRSIPEDATYRLTVEDGDGEQLYQDFGSDSLTADLGDGWFEDGSGTYRAIVEAIAGADCSTSYLLTVSIE